LQLVI